MGAPIESPGILAVPPAVVISVSALFLSDNSMQHASATEAE
jgi:hypothetical protein